jgi:N-acetylglutamate synthase-like GNAT family acetyltransferase
VKKSSFEVFPPPRTLSRKMNSSSYRVRRATLDDLPKLTALWASMHFAPDDLGKRITEFQIAENAEGELVGAVGLELAQKQARIHSEAFTDFALADALRPLLWERLQSVATNHGLLRFWTQEHAPFWKHCGLAKADDETVQKLPLVWKTHGANWLTLKLRDDLNAIVSADREFAMFMEAEKQRSLRTMQHAKILKIIAAIIAFGVIAMALGGAFYLIRKRPNLIQR